MQVPLEPSQGARVRCPDRADRVEPGGTGKTKKIQKPNVSLSRRKVQGDMPIGEQGKWQHRSGMDTQGQINWNLPQTARIGWLLP